jgi:hypothetical protein
MTRFTWTSTASRRRSAVAHRTASSVTPSPTTYATVAAAVPGPPPASSVVPLRLTLVTAGNVGVPNYRQVDRRYRRPAVVEYAHAGRERRQPGDGVVRPVEGVNHPTQVGLRVGAVVADDDRVSGNAVVEYRPNPSFGLGVDVRTDVGVSVFDGHVTGVESFAKVPGGCLTGGGGDVGRRVCVRRRGIVRRFDRG